MKKLIFSLFVSLTVIMLMNSTLIFNGNKADAIKLSTEIQIASAGGQCWLYLGTGVCYCDQQYDYACIGICGTNRPKCDMITPTP